MHTRRSLHRLTIIGACLLCLGHNSLFSAAHSGAQRATSAQRVVATTQGASQRQKAFAFTEEDLLVTFSTYPPNEAIIQASRLWRKGVRTHIVVDPDVDIQRLRQQGDEHLETYAVIPEFRGYPHPMRQAFVPMSAYDAHSAHGPPSFQWLLLGDDDTVFVIPAVLEMLNNLQLDPREPALLSDFLVVNHHECELPKKPCGGAPRIVDPRCQPCPSDQAVCPCRLAPGCTVRNREAAKKNCYYDVSFFGGAGAVMSIGLLQQLGNVSAMRYYSEVMEYMGFGTTLSDVCMSEVLRWHGFGFTHTQRLPAAGAYPRHPPPASSTRLGGPTSAAPPPYGLGPGGPPPNLFATFCAHADTRSPQELAAGLAAARDRYPEAFRRMVSVHVRTATSRTGRRVELGPAFLEPYQQVVELLMDRGG